MSLEYVQSIFHFTLQYMLMVLKNGQNKTDEKKKRLHWLGKLGKFDIVNSIGEHILHINWSEGNCD